MFTFDANILFYAGDDRDPGKMARSAELLRAAATQGIAFLTLQTLGEFAHASVRKGLLSRRRAAELVRDWSSWFTIRHADSDALDIALNWWADEKLSYWDALLIATAMKCGAAALVSEDMQDGFVIGGVEIVNPFASHAVERLSVYGLKL